MYIIDHIYIRIIPAALRAAIKIYLASISNHQTTTNQCNYPPNRNCPILSHCITTKQNTITLMKYALNALEIGEKITLPVDIIEYGQIPRVLLA